jgi:exonuclease III
MRKRFTGALAVSVALAAGIIAASCSSEQETTLTVMSFNIWGGGANEDKPVDETVAAIEAVDPDIVGIQETRLEGPKCTARFCPPRGRSVAKELKDALGYQYYEQTQLEDDGFVDAFRAANPDPVAKPAFTWTPSSKPTVSWDHHDRIDFVLARADELEVESAAIVGEKRPEADVVVRPWPSDHRAVAATVRY